MIDVNAFLLLSGGIFIIGLLSELMFSKTGISDTILLLAIGIAIGPWLGLFEPAALMVVAPYVAPIALMLILFESGLALNLYKVIYQSPRAILLSMLDVILSVAFCAIAMNLAFGWDYLSGALFGAIVSGTSSVTVISLLKQIKPCDETEDVLVLESVITDMLTVVVSIALIKVVLVGGFFDMKDLMGGILSAFSIGAMFGISGAAVWLYILHKLHIASPKPMMALASIAILYATTEIVGGSGAISTLFFGIILGNSTELANAFRFGPLLVDLSNVKLFQTEISLFVRTFFFVYLGAIFVAQNMLLVMVGLLISVGLMFIRRFGVLASAFGSKVLQDDSELISAIAPRGLAAAVVSQLPLSYGLALARDYMELTLTVIIATTLFSTFLIWRWKRRKDVESIAKADARVERKKRAAQRP